MFGATLSKKEGGAFILDPEICQFFAAICMVYDDPEWLELVLRTIYPLVGSIFLLVASRPWFGERTDNSSTLEIIKHLPDPDNKIRLVRRDWLNQVDARNDGMDLVKSAGYRYGFVVDADEVYEPEVLQRMMKHALEKPEIDCWHMRWFTYWKSVYYRIMPAEAYAPPVFLKANGSARFSEYRNVDATTHELIPPEVGICHHLSYARSDEDILRKIKSFGHAPQVKPDWFKNVWKAWDNNHELRNLHPTNPEQYDHTIAQNINALPTPLKQLLASTAK